MSIDVNASAFAFVTPDNKDNNKLSFDKILTQSPAFNGERSNIVKFNAEYNKTAPNLNIKNIKKENELSSLETGIYIVKDGDNLEKIIKDNYKDISFDIKKEIINSNPDIDFSKTIAKDSLIILPSVDIENNDRFVNPKEMKLSLNGTRYIFMPVMNTLLQTDLIAMQAIAAGTNFSSLESVIKAAALSAGTVGATTIARDVIKEEDYQWNLTREFIDKTLKTDEANSFIISQSTPGLNKLIKIPNLNTLSKSGSGTSNINLRAATINTSVSLEIPRPAVNSTGKDIQLVSFILDIGIAGKGTSNIDFGGNHKDETIKKRSKASNEIVINAKASKTLTYRLADTEERIRDFVLGIKPAPNPFTFENFLPGSAITLDTTTTYQNGAEARFFLKPKRLKSGIGPTGVGATQTQSGERVMIQMALAKDGSRHVTVFSGASASETTTAGGGGIFNKDIPQGEKKLKISAAHINLLTQREKLTRTNRYNFIEVNVDTKEGRAIYDEIMKTGKIPIADKNKKIDGIEAHGQLVFKQTKLSTQIETNQYLSKNWTGIAKHYAGDITEATQTWEPGTGYEVHRFLKVNYSGPKSILKEDTPINTNPTGENTIGNYPFNHGSANKHLYRTDDNAGVINIYKDNETNQKEMTSLLSTKDAPKNHIINILRKNIDKEKRNRRISVPNIILNTPNGKITGENALKYLQKNGDFVDINIETKNIKLTQEFFANLKSDIEKYHSYKNNGSWTEFYSNWFLKKIDKAEFEINQNDFNYLDPDNPYFAEEIAKANTPLKMAKALTYVDMGQFLNFLDEMGGDYPIEVNVFVE